MRWTSKLTATVPVHKALLCSAWAKACLRRSTIFALLPSRSPNAPSWAQTSSQIKSIFAPFSDKDTDIFSPLLIIHSFGLNLVLCTFIYSISDPEVGQKIYRVIIQRLHYCYCTWCTIMFRRNYVSSLMYHIFSCYCIRPVLKKTTRVLIME